MKSFYLEDINEEGFKKFLEFIDDVEEGKGIVYIDSSGGLSCITSAILDRCERSKVELRLIYGASNGFELFYRYSGPKFLELNSNASVHTTATPFHIFRHNGKIKIREGSLTDKQQSSSSQLDGGVSYEFLTEEETNICNDGGIVYLTYDRLKKIFKQD